MPIPSERLAFLSRVSQVRREFFGDDGIPELAEALGIPAQTWVNYESGVMIPDTIILHFVCLTDAAPQWLLTGEGHSYSAHAKPIIQFG